MNLALALSILDFNTFIQIFNPLSKTIIGLPRTLADDIILQNIIIMVKSTVVRGPSLARLAMVLVWQRAVNRQPGSRSNNS